MAIEQPSPVKYDMKYSASVHYTSPKPFISKEDEEKMDARKVEPAKTMKVGDLDIKYDRNLSDDYNIPRFYSWKATAEDIKPADNYNAPISSKKKTIKPGAVLGGERKIHLPHERDTHPDMYVNDDRVVISDWNNYGPWIQRAYNVKTTIKGMHQTFSGEARPTILSLFGRFKENGAKFRNPIKYVGVGNVEGVLGDELKEKKPYMVIHSLDEAISAELNSFERHRASEELKLRRAFARAAGVPQRKVNKVVDDSVEDETEVSRVYGNYQHANLMEWLARHSKEHKPPHPAKEILTKSWKRLTGQSLEQRLDREWDPEVQTGRALRIVP